MRERTRTAIGFEQLKGDLGLGEMGRICRVPGTVRHINGKDSTISYPCSMIKAVLLRPLVSLLLNNVPRSVCHWQC